MVDPFQEGEIRCAVWACSIDKSPGPDAFNFRFIKHFWKELKPEFLRFTAEFHVNASFPKGINSSFIAFIPKIKDPQSIGDFRPISIIGCVYKVIANLLDNVKAVKAILRSSEMVSGLRINFAKSQFRAIGQSKDRCCLAADFLDCALQLGKWNQRSISMAGTLINVVLTVLPLFYLSFSGPVQK